MLRRSDKIVHVLIRRVRSDHDDGRFEDQAHDRRQISDGVFGLFVGERSGDPGVGEYRDRMIVAPFVGEIGDGLQTGAGGLVDNSDGLREEFFPLRPRDDFAGKDIRAATKGAMNDQLDGTGRPIVLSPRGREP